jgi:hypothetical protein
MDNLSSASAVVCNPINAIALYFTGEQDLAVDLSGEASGLAPQNIKQTIDRMFAPVVIIKHTPKLRLVKRPAGSESL